MMRSGWLLLAGCVGIGFAVAHGAPPEANSETGVKWRALFDGKTLKNWKPTNFGGEGEVTVEEGQILMQQGSDLSGITWTGGELPRSNYEISLEAQRVDGGDFFCGLTVPVKDAPCSLIVGGWGGGVVGLSSLNGLDASENETTSYRAFKKKEWYKIRLRVTDTHIQAWIGDDRVVNADIRGKTISIRPEVELSKPLGISSYATVAALREIRIRDLTAAEIAEDPTAKKK
jgi:hypothetical protein